MAKLYLVYSRSTKEEKGPYLPEMIREFVRSGHLTAKNICKTEGMPDWAPIGEVDEFSDFFRATEEPVGNSPSAPRAKFYMVQARGSAKPQGPYLPGMVRTFVATSHFAKDDLCWTEGMPGWLPVGEVGELAQKPDVVEAPVKETPKVEAIAAKPSAVVEPAKETAVVPEPTAPFPALARKWNFPKGPALIGIIAAAMVILAIGLESLVYLGRTRQSPSATPVVAQNPAPRPVPAGAAPSVTANTPQPAPVTPPPSPGGTSAQPRTPTSRAIEAYLRYRLVGGVTDRQIVETADAMAKIFDSLDLTPEQKQACYVNGPNEPPQIALYKIFEVKPDAGLGLQRDFYFCTPPRMLLDYPLSEKPYHDSNEKPLPPREWDRSSDRHKPGTLFTESLVTLEHAMSVITSTKYKPKSADYYWSNVVRLVPDGTMVLDATYLNGQTGMVEHHYYWYQTRIENYDLLARTVSPENPIFDIGPPLTEAPEQYVPPQQEPPTVDDIRNGVLRSIALGSPGGTILSPTSVRYDTLVDNVFKNYGVITISKFRLTSPPVADASGGYVCSYKFSAGLQFVKLDQIANPLLPPDLEASDTETFQNGPQGWWSPAIQNNDQKIQADATNGTTRNLGQLFNLKAK